MLLMDISAEPCPQSSSQIDCDVLQQLQDSAPKEIFMENSLGSQDNISQLPETPEHAHQTHYLSLSNISTSKLLTENGGTGVCWDQTLPLLRYQDSPQISTKKRQAPPTTKDCSRSSVSKHIKCKVDLKEEIG